MFTAAGRYRNFILCALWFYLMVTLPLFYWFVAGRKLNDAI
jgi:hypothetical protein